MGLLRSSQICESELDVFHTMIKQIGRLFNKWDWKSEAVGSKRGKNGNEGSHNKRMVCVTSGKSLVGLAIVRRLLSQGYFVRLTVQTQEDAQKVMEMEMFQLMSRDSISVLVADLMNIDSLCQTFDGCSGVFHTSAFVDSSGVSGYTKYMSYTEARSAEVVVEACAKTESVRKCVFTSSLLACVWQRREQDCPELLTIVNERCWSDESLCGEKKLWYALGKTMAKRAAWRVAKTGRKNLKLVTICPALIAGQQNSIAYLKGAQEMLAEGLLTSVLLHNIAEAHVYAYEDDTACGRYLCFDNPLIPGTQEAEQLLAQFNKTDTCNTDQQNSQIELCNRKFSRLLARQRRCSYDTYTYLY